MLSPAIRLEPLAQRASLVGPARAIGIALPGSIGIAARTRLIVLGDGPTLPHATTTKATVGGAGGRIANPILRLVSYETAAGNCFVWIAVVCLTLRQHGQERDRETGSSKLCSHTNSCMQSVRIIAALLTTAPADLIFYEPVYSRS